MASNISAASASPVTFETRVKVTIDESLLLLYKQSENGDVGRYMRFLGVSAKKEAERLAKRRLSPVGGPRYNDWHRAGNKKGRPPGRTGEYDKAFYYRTYPRGDTRQMVLGNRKDYSWFVEKGSGPAEIGADGRRLNFFSNHLYKYVYIPGPVYHPGAFTTFKTNKVWRKHGAQIMNDAVSNVFKISYTPVIAGLF